MLGHDLLIGVRTGNFGDMDLRRYSRFGDSLPISQNPPGRTAVLLDIHQERAIWAEYKSGRVFAVYGGDGLEPITTIYEPPEAQSLTLLDQWLGLRFFLLESGEDAQRFSNILVYADGQVRQLTDNGPGWLAELYLPYQWPNYYPPDAVVAVWQSLN